MSFTEFNAEHFRTLPGILWAGLRLRQGWYAMDGAVGLFLWGQTLRSRGGSLSVWTEEDSLRRFARLPLHVEIVRKFHERIRVRSVMWTQDWVGPSELRRSVSSLFDIPTDVPITVQW
ncbi:MAG TPA: hypothetical protein VI462_03420, partial [Acidimicrobiia bacterium]